MTSSAPAETPFFDAILMHDQEQAVIAGDKDRIERVASHRKSMKLCWPQWNGPKVDSESVDGYCSVNCAIVHSITHGENRYHYMAPCRIIGIEDNRKTIIAEIQYEQGSTCEHYNGELLRLDITEVWAPVYLMNRFNRISA